MAHDHGHGHSRSVPCQIGGDDDRVDRLRADNPSQSEGDAVSELFKLLGDPTRLRILSAWEAAVCWDDDHAKRCLAEVRPL